MDILQRLIPVKILQNWLRRFPNDDELSYRVDVLEASGLPSDRERNWKEYQDLCRKMRHAWNVYVASSDTLGVLSADHKRKLQSPDWDQFHSALDEAMTAWYLCGVQKAALVEKEPQGNCRHRLELSVQKGGQIINVEVKSVRTPSPEEWEKLSAWKARGSKGKCPLSKTRQTMYDPDFGVWYGDNSGLIKEAVENAGRQFKKEEANVLVVVPSFRKPLWQSRVQLIHALFGFQAFSFSVGNGSAPCNVTPVFKPNGHFIRQHKGEPQPRYTRIGAVVSIEERLVPQGIIHEVLVVHNPNALCPIEKVVFESVPQFISNNGEGSWTDGANIWSY